MAPNSEWPKLAELQRPKAGLLTLGESMEVPDRLKSSSPVEWSKLPEEQRTVLEKDLTYNISFCIN